jgi:hypothetical protein
VSHPRKERRVAEGRREVKSEGRKVGSEKGDLSRPRKVRGRERRMQSQ